MTDRAVASGDYVRGLPFVPGKKPCLRDVNELVGYNSASGYPMIGYKDILRT